MATIQATALNKSPIKVVQASVIISKIAQEETEIRIKNLRLISFGCAIATMLAIPARKGRPQSRVDS
jgi:hypothetical protein